MRVPLPFHLSKLRCMFLLLQLFACLLLVSHFYHTSRALDSTSPSPSNSQLCGSGILSSVGLHCCARACGTCDGGPGCGNKTGGGRFCCHREIRRSGRVCRYPKDTGCMVVAGDAVLHPAPLPSSETPNYLKAETSWKTKKPTKKKKKKTDLVMSLGTDIEPQRLAIFAGSLREHNTDSVLALWLRFPLPQRMATLTERYGVEALDYAVALEKLQTGLGRSFHPRMARFPIMFDYLSRRLDKHSAVLVIDPSDSMFQLDLFLQAFPPPIKTRGASARLPEERKLASVAFAESEAAAVTAATFYAFPQFHLRYPIIRDRKNRGYIEEYAAAGNSGFDTSKILEEQLLCAGVSLGTAAAMLDYLRLMADTITAQGVDISGRYGMDQAIHNVLIHTGKVSGFTIVPAASSWVANLLDERYAKVNATARLVDGRGDAGWVRNLRLGRTVAVVHQYDRAPGLAAALLERYVDWDLQRADEAGGGDGGGAGAGEWSKDLGV